ncbi:hypothetical protein [Herpetosiphon gulosus]|uniref:Uncharacterized protein n=1 Tax=Herpetosiphon gulosus TaxID=1973496 RepID=A0ABP9X9J9_9CHLR
MQHPPIPVVTLNNRASTTSPSYVRMEVEMDSNPVIMTYHRIRQAPQTKPLCVRIRYIVAWIIDDVGDPGDDVPDQGQNAELTMPT